MNTDEHVLHVEKPPYVTLIIKYALIAVYGAFSGWVGIATLDVVAGQLWGVLWPALVTVFSLLAMFAVIRSRITEKEGLELVSTLLLISLLIGYSIAIVTRTTIDGNVTRLPVALLPIILSVFPARRLVQIARKGA